jgi:protein TonB
MEIGLVIALAAVVGAFAWGQTEKKVEALTDVTATVEPEVVVNTEQEQRQPEVRPQQVQAISDFLEVVRDDTVIETEYNFDDFSEDFVVEVPVAVEEEVTEEVPIYNAEEMPVPPGGDINAFRRWLQGELRYPQIALENNISGTVTLKFVVERDGTLTGIETIASPDKSLTDEAIRVLSRSAKWVPGKQRNKPVRVFYTMPVVFNMIQN